MCTFKKRSMPAWISCKSSCRHGDHASTPAATSQFCCYWDSGLESGVCFAALPVPALHQHMVRQNGQGCWNWCGTPAHQCGGVGSLCIFGDQQQEGEWCTAPGRTQTRLPKGPAASPHPSRDAVSQGFLLMDIKLTKLTIQSPFDLQEHLHGGTDILPRLQVDAGIFLLGIGSPTACSFPP